MTLFLKTFFLIFSLSLLLYWLPNFGIPLHSDVTWIFRLQTSEINPENLPPWSKVIGAYPGSPWETFINYRKFSGRYNFLDWKLFRLTAEIFGSNADGWRFGYLIILSGATTLFYLISQILKINRLVAFILVFGLMLSPVSVWADYKTSEPKALLLLMLAYYLALKFSNFWAWLFSSIAIFAAALAKESFLGASILVPALIYLKNWKNGRQNLKIFFPYIFALFSLGIYFLVLNHLFPAEGPDYVFGVLRSSFSTPAYFFYSFWNNLPLILTANSFIVGILLLSFIIFLSLPSLKKQKIIILSLLLAFLASVIPYFLTKRDIYGHYLLPGNYLMALLIGIFLTAFYKRLRNSPVVFKALILLWVGITFTFQLANIFSNSISDRQEQVNWQNLNNEVLKYPQRSNIVLYFRDPLMAELAYSLEANAIISGRHDLNFRLLIEDKSLYQTDSGFIKKGVDLFNFGKNFSSSSEGDAIYIKASRSTDHPYLNWQVMK